jgi:hypothetical protein
MVIPKNLIPRTAVALIMILYVLNKVIIPQSIDYTSVMMITPSLYGKNMFHMYSC